MKKALSVRACFFSFILSQRIPRSLFRLLCSLLLFIPAFAISQPDWTWAKSVNTTQAEFVNDVAVDTGSAEVVAVGVFNSDISAFYGSNFTGAIGGGFVAKYDDAGNVLWAFRIGNNQDDACNGVAIDASGNIYVTGYFENIADFRGMSATPNVLTAGGLRDAYIAKYNSAGMLQWVKSGGGSNNDEGRSVCVNYNTVFVTGFFNQSASFGTLNTPAAFANDNTFIVAYNYSGTEQWLGEVGSLQPGYGYDVSADSSNVFLCGVFKAATASVYHASGVLAYTLNNSVPGQNDGFIISYSSAGVCSWANVIHSSSDDAPNSLIVKGSSLYLTGSVSNPATFPGFASNPLTPSGNGKEIFLASINKTTGNTTWALTEPGSNGDQEAQGICTGSGNEIYVSGYFSNNVLFGGSTTLTSLGLDDAFVSVYNTSGIFQRAYKSSSTGVERAPAIAIDNEDAVYVGGRYDDLFTAGTLSLPDNLLFNAFLAKIACIPVTNTISSAQSVCTGSAPLALNGITSGGMAPFFYLWQESANNLAWSNAAGVNNTSTYSPPALTASTYYRRILTSSAICSEVDTSVSIMITVDQMPSVSVAGVDQTVCGDSVSLDATNPAVGTGTWSVASGGGTFENVNKDTSDVTALTYGSNNFIWTVTNGACPPSKDTVQISAYQAPDTIEAGNNFNVCSSAATLNALTPAVGSGTWSVITGAATVNSVSSPNSSVTGLNSGLNSFQWIVSNGNCPALRDTVSITVDDLPDVAVAGNDQIFCGDSTTINANAPVVGSGSWSFATGGGNLNNVNAATTDVTNLMNGINTIVWTISNGACPPTTDTIIVRAFYPPTIANAGTDQALCSYSTVLNANTAIYGTGSWISLTSGPVFSSVFSPGVSVTSLVTGQNIFVWKITNGVCTPSTDTVIIQVDTLPSIADAGNDQTLCDDSSTLAANVPVVGIGTWTIFSGAGNFSNSSSATSSVSGMNSGANNFIWTISNGVCPSSSDTITIFSSAPVTISNAGSDQTICTDSALLNANTPISGNGTWNVVTPGSTLLSPASPNTGVINLSVGQNIFEWIISNGVCPDSRDTVIIYVDAVPSAAVAGPDLNVCGDSVLLNGSTPVNGTGTWTVISGTGNFNNANSPVANVNGMNVGLNSFAWTIANGVCPSESDTVIINSFAQVTVANAGTDSAVCDSSIVLYANSPSSGSGTWNVISFGSSVSSSSVSNPVANLVSGPNIFEWIISNGVCTDSRDTIIVYADELPDQSIAGLDQVICGDSAVLNANDPVTGTGMWTVSVGGGNVSSNSSDSTAVINLASGINSFIWTISNGVCPSSSDTVNINAFDVVSPASAGADLQVCSSSAVLSALTPSSGNGSWNVISAGPVILSPSSATTTVDSLLVGQNFFEWIVSNGVCPDSRDTVIISVDANPGSANAGVDDSVCGTSALLTANVPLVGTGTWSVIGGASSIADPDSATTTVSGLSLGNNFFIWTISNGICPTVSDTVNITSLQLVTPSNAGSDQQICSSSSLLNANTPVNGTGNWNLLSSGPVLSSLSDPQASVTALNIGTNIFEWVISNGICPDSKDSVVVVVDAMPSTANAGTDIVTELSSVDLAAATPVIGTGAWNIISGEGNINSVSDPAATISGLQQGETILSWTISNGSCPSSTDTLRIYNNELYIPQVITPNGDGLNDFFEIKAFENHGGPKFELYNRWGTKVYSAANYQNNFDGSNAQGIVLADDTYFYVIETADDKTYKGYLIIKRK